MEHEEDINDKFTLIKYAVLAGIPLALILIEPNLSTTICTALMICLMIYIAGLSYKFIGTVLIILVPIAVIFLSIVVQRIRKSSKIISRNVSLLSSNRKNMKVMKHISRKIL